MAGTITALSRRPPKWILLVPLAVLGIIALSLYTSALHYSTPFSIAEWRGILLCMAMLSWFYWVFTSIAVADYDLDYLYFFTKGIAVPIPLGRFYKFEKFGGGKNAWHLFYQDEQNRKKKLMIVPIQAAFSWRKDHESINAFIHVVQQHNLNLDLGHG